MTIDEAVKLACNKPTLLDALTFICVWESERAIKQARFNYGSGSNGAGWDTCFKFCLKEVLNNYNSQRANIVSASREEEREEKKMSDVTEEKKDKFCRLCGKNKSIDDFCDIVLATNPQQTQAIMYKGCKLCAVTVHNTQLILKETFDRERERLRLEAEKKIALAGPKIIIPGHGPIKLN